MLSVAPAPMSIVPARSSRPRPVAAVVLRSAQLLLPGCLLLAAWSLRSPSFGSIGVLAGWNGMVWATGLQAAAGAMGASARHLSLAFATTAVALPICLIGLTARGTETICAALAVALAVAYLARIGWLTLRRPSRR